MNTTCETTVSLPEDSDEQQEVIEVQILPQVSHASIHSSIYPLIHPSVHCFINPWIHQWIMCIPQDENWGETTTAVTNVSELDYAMEDLSKWQIDNQRSFQFRCRHFHHHTIAPSFSITIFSPQVSHHCSITVIPIILNISLRPQVQPEPVPLSPASSSSLSS